MPAIKAVIDTSVMVSLAFAKSGLAQELRNLIAREEFTLVASREILAELFRVLNYPRIIQQFNPSKEDIDEFIGLIVEKALLTEGRYTVLKIKNDPADNMFLSCALEAKADFIVSRDPHLRNLKHFHGVRIIDVKGFVRKVRSE